MGGFSSFQKRFGDATVANETLKAVKAGNQPDIHKMAKMFAPDMELIPVTKTWYKKFGFSDWEAVFDGVYFGIFTLSHNSVVVGKSDNNYRRSFCNIKHLDAIKLSSFIGYHGDDILPMHSNAYEYIGFGTSCEILSPWGEECEHGFSLSFIGFKLEELPYLNLKIKNNASGTIEVTVADVTVNIPSGNEFDWVEPLGTAILITPDYDQFLDIEGNRYNNEEPFSRNLIGNTVIEVSDMILVMVSIPDPQVLFSFSINGVEFTRSTQGSVLYDFLLFKNDVFGINRIEHGEGALSTVIYEGDTFTFGNEGYSFDVAAPISLELGYIGL